MKVVPHSPAAILHRSIVGKRADSRTVQNKLTDVVANANRGDYRVRVGAFATHLFGLQQPTACNAGMLRRQLTWSG